MRDKIERFMMGRYGQDPLNKTLLFTAIGCMLASMFWRPLYTISMILLFITIFRMFSRNYAARSREQEIYADFTRKTKNRLFGTKTHKIFTCRNCHQQIRVPRGKGKIVITCPKCKNQFTKRT